MFRVSAQLSLTADTRLSDLLPNERELIERMHSFQHGVVKDLRVQSGRIVGQTCKVRRTGRLDRPNRSEHKRPMASDFKLVESHQRLIALIHATKDNVFRIVFRDGLPCQFEAEEDLIFSACG